MQSDSDDAYDVGKEKSEEEDNQEDLRLLDSNYKWNFNDPKAKKDLKSLITFVKTILYQNQAFWRSPGRIDTSKNEQVFD